MWMSILMRQSFTLHTTWSYIASSLIPRYILCRCDSLASAQIHAANKVSFLTSLVSDRCFSLLGLVICLSGRSNWSGIREEPDRESIPQLTTDPQGKSNGFDESELVLCVTVFGCSSCFAVNPTAPIRLTLAVTHQRNLPLKASFSHPCRKIVTHFDSSDLLTNQRTTDTDTKKITCQPAPSHEQ
jgi:hypothetical protein